MTAGSRILFGIPWGERVILGTTDTDYNGPPEAVTADEPDMAYILEIVNASFPDAALTPADVVHTWAGIRPLIDTGPARGCPVDPSDISRAHQIRMPEPGWFDVAGGKLTNLSPDCAAGGRFGRPLPGPAGRTVPYRKRAPAAARSG